MKFDESGQPNIEREAKIIPIIDIIAKAVGKINPDEPYVPGVPYKLAEKILDSKGETIEDKVNDMFKTSFKDTPELRKAHPEIYEGLNKIKALIIEDLQKKYPNGF